MKKAALWAVIFVVLFVVTKLVTAGERGIVL